MNEQFELSARNHKSYKSLQTKVLFSSSYKVLLTFLCLIITNSFEYSFLMGIQNIQNSKPRDIHLEGSSYMHLTSLLWLLTQ